MRIGSQFDSGNIDVEEIREPSEAALRIRRDAGGSFKQWFYFRVAGVRGKPLRLRIVDAGECSYAAGFSDFRAVASYDRRRWFRVDTTFDGQELVLHLTPEHDAVYVAAFAPYPVEVHHDAVARWSTSPFVRHEVIGSTLDGRDIDLLRIGSGREDTPRLWVIGRQHPGEPMASWFVEGFMERLIDPGDPVAIQLRRSATVYVVPLINPDGVFRGYLRTNAAGADLNREWENPTADRSPEVLHVLRQMDRIGVEGMLDIHGDEQVNHTYIYGLHTPPSGDPHAPRLLRSFTSALETLTPDFRARNLPADDISKPNFAMCTQQVAARFRCLAATVEMPFHDADWMRNAREGFSPDRCRHFGASCLQALFAILDDLRDLRSSRGASTRSPEARD